MSDTMGHDDHGDGLAVGDAAAADQAGTIRQRLQGNAHAVTALHCEGATEAFRRVSAGVVVVLVAGSGRSCDAGLQ